MRLRPGGWCWVALAGGIAVADAILIKTEHETMSEVFADATAHPVKRWPVIAAWGVLTVHLFQRFMPEAVTRFDPIEALGSVAEHML